MLHTISAPFLLQRLFVCVLLTNLIVFLLLLLLLTILSPLLFHMPDGEFEEEDWISWLTDHGLNQINTKIWHNTDNVSLNFDYAIVSYPRSDSFCRLAWILWSLQYIRLMSICVEHNFRCFRYQMANFSYLSSPKIYAWNTRPQNKIPRERSRMNRSHWPPEFPDHIQISIIYSIILLLFRNLCRSRTITHTHIGLQPI